MEDFDDRAQRIQDRLREEGDDEAAELIDELFGLWYAEQEKGQKPVKKRWQDDPLQQVQVWDSAAGKFKTVRKTKEIAEKMTLSAAR